jgi:hypothetical protein
VVVDEWLDEDRARQAAVRTATRDFVPAFRP